MHDRGCEEAEKSVFILLHDRTNEVNSRSEVGIDTDESVECPILI